MCKEKVILFCDSASGQYIPQRFAEELDLDRCTLNGVQDNELAILKCGPDHEHYWDVWAAVEDNARIVVKSTGQTFFLYQDGDLWLIDETAVPGEDHEFWEAA